MSVQDAVQRLCIVQGPLADHDGRERGLRAGDCLFAQLDRRTGRVETYGFTRADGQKLYFYKTGNNNIGDDKLIGSEMFADRTGRDLEIGVEAIARVVAFVNNFSWLTNTRNDESMIVWQFEGPRPQN